MNSLFLRASFMRKQWWELEIPQEKKVGDICTPLARGQTDLTPSEVIVGVVVRFKRSRVSTVVESGVPILTIEAHVVEFLYLNFYLYRQRFQLLGTILGLFLRKMSLMMLFSTSLLVNLLSVSQPWLRRRGNLWMLLVVEG